MYINLDYDLNDRNGMVIIHYHRFTQDLRLKKKKGFLYLPKTVAIIRKSSAELFVKSHHEIKRRLLDQTHLNINLQPSSVQIKIP